MEASGGSPQWFDLARLDLATAEIAGSRHNPAILRYFQDAGHSEVTNDETAWCAAFVCAMLERCGVRSTRSLWARDFLQWGVSVEGAPRRGDIVVFARGPTFGHVAFFDAFNEDDSQVRVLGGNQSDKVCYAWYPSERILGFRRPAPEARPQPKTAHPPVPMPVPVTKPPAAPQPVLPFFDTPAKGEDEIEFEARQQLLRRNGSRTIENADQGARIVKGAAGGFVGLQVVSTVADQLRDFMPAAETIRSALTFAKEYQGLVISLVLLVLFLNFKKIIIARVTDSLSGAHSGKVEADAGEPTARTE